MLTRLEVDGFKTFENLVIDLAPFTVIVGSNAAGKSNLFDVIQLLANLATRDVAEAFKEMRGEPLELFRQTAAGRGHQIRLAAEVLVDPIVRDPWGSEVRLSHTRMRYEVALERRTIKPGIERIQVAHEQLLPIMRKDDRWTRWMPPTKEFRARYLKYNRSKAWLTTEERTEGLTFSVHQDGKQGRNRPASAAEATVLYSITNAEFPHLFALREEMRHWRLLQLDPALLRKPVPATASDVLAADGSNLAAVLAQVKAETATKERPGGVLSDIVAELNGLIPGITALDADLHEASREYRIQLTMRDGVPFSSRVISDGTLRVLALLTLLHDPRHRGVTCFEEPENGVHPARIKQLIWRLRDMVSYPQEFLAGDEPAPLSQLLLNSHSPVVLSALIDKEFSLRTGILFADTATVSDPEKNEQRRKTRLRPVSARPQTTLFGNDDVPQGFVSDWEVRNMLETVSAEG
ncbi:AAA family ATPase [Accumulibacter sp.]|jgi:predicted ATPase|uniref:AAA family ATPase n=1 Tax=Accumulibacter sp. TaxID=2053492 RepID=UPI00159A71D8|nr:MAG: AAA family ATPase [Candidatus Accumulibacter similis]